jgi:preprotein translocase subunit SecE
VGSTPSAPAKRNWKKKKMAKTSPAKFVEQVKQEARKVTWPTRKETTAATIMVLIMVTIASIFFFFVDWLISTGLQVILGL